MRRLLRRAQITALVVVLAALALPGTASAATQVTQFPYTEALFNPCNEDLVLINGKLVLKLTVTTNNNQFHFAFAEYRNSLTAQSVFTGDEYSYTRHTSDVSHTTGNDGTFVTRITETLHLVRHGDTRLPTDDDLFVTLRFEARSDPNTGETVIRKNEFEAECR